VFLGDILESPQRCRLLHTWIAYIAVSAYANLAVILTNVSLLARLSDFDEPVNGVAIMGGALGYHCPPT
jgi:hypothetical protein